ncbi:MAG TPA: hypothetical protein VJ853_06830 [Thermoanaerobaculia bacterium]|nr:hypothetical protein [Thermoanaerobaculia bacterium]
MRRFALILLAFSSIAHAQSGEWGSRGITHRLVAAGNRVYAADGRGVAVYDVSTTPVRRVGVAETIGESLDVAPIGNDLLVATRAGVERYAVGSDGSLTDLANYPGATPTIIAANASGTYVAGFSGSSITVWSPDMSPVAVFPVPQPVGALAWHGDTLIAALPNTAIMMFDAKGNSPPLIVSETAEDLAVSGDTLYVAAGVDGVAQYDISNDAAPRFVSRAPAGEKNFTRIAVSGNRLIAAEVPNAIDVFDLSSGTAVLTNRFDEPVETIAASGASLFDAGTVVDAHGFTRATGAPLRVWDLSDPAMPALAGQYTDFAGPVSGVATDGSLAYVVDPPFFRVIDIATTASPREIASIPIDNIGDYVRARGNLAIIYGRLQVQIVDVSNPYAPRLIRTWNTQGAAPSTAAFVGTNFIEANPASGFHVVDFNDYPTPQQIGGIKGHYYDVVSDGGDVAYVAQEGVTLGTVDIANPLAPALVTSSVIAPVETEIAAATANHPELLVSQTKSGIRIYTLANPRSPVLASTTPTMATGVVAADGDSAYVALPDNIQKIDLTNPAQPQFIPTTMLAVAPMRIAAANGKIVIADKYSLRIYGPDTAPPPPASPQRRHVADH